MGMRERGHRAVLVAHPGGVLYRRASEGDDLVPLSPRSEVDLASAWRLSKIIASYRPDVVHAHDPHAVAMASMAMSFQGRAAAPPLVASRRVDFHLRSTRSRAGSTARSRCSSPPRRRSATSWCATAFRPTASSSSTTASTSSASTKVPPADIHQTFWFPKGAPVVVNVGALVNHKGQKFLIDAMAQVRRQIPDAQLVIFGEGDLREPLTRQIHDLGLDKHVLLAGFRDDVLGLTRSADLFVMSSVTEGLGSAVLDAMALGLPVVGTRAGGIPEAVDDGVTGRLVPPGRADALADAIVLMLRDPATRRHMGEAGRERVHAEFGLDRLVEGTLAAYRTVAQNVR